MLQLDDTLKGVLVGFEQGDPLTPPQLIDRAIHVISEMVDTNYSGLYVVGKTKEAIAYLESAGYKGFEAIGIVAIWMMAISGKNASYEGLASQINKEVFSNDI